MECSLAQIASLVKGTVAGQSDRPVRGVAPFEDAGDGDITLAGTSEYIKRIPASPAGAFIVPRQVQGVSRNLVAVDNPMRAFAQVIRLFHPLVAPPAGIHPLACVADDLRCGADVSIGPFVVIGRRVSLGRRVQVGAGALLGDDVSLGDDVVLHPHVVVGERCLIGARVIVHSGTVIGSDGFGFAPDGGGYYKIPQIGIVQIDDDVEIGANNTIDRATFGKTWIGRGVKTDNLVHIAHNVTIGADTVIVAQVGISGSVTVGRNVILAGQAGISGHLTIGDGAVVGPASGVVKSVSPGEVVIGLPALPRMQQLRVQAVVSKLPDIKKRIEALEKKIGNRDEMEGK